MDLFSELQSDEHPLLIRLLLALIVSFVLVFVLSLAAPILYGVRISRGIALLPFFLAPLLLLGLHLKKAGKLSPAMALSFVLVSCLQWFNMLVFAGVINYWLSLFVGLTWVLTVYFAQARRRQQQIAIYSLMIVIIALTTYLSLPNYTYTQAKTNLAAELEISLDQVGPGMGFMPTIDTVGSNWPSVFVSKYYFFDTLVEGVRTTYIFDPVSGEWVESLPGRLGVDVQ